MNVIKGSSNPFFINPSYILYIRAGLNQIIAYCIYNINGYKYGLYI